MDTFLFYTALSVLTAGSIVGWFLAIFGPWIH